MKKNFRNTSVSLIILSASYLFVDTTYALPAGVSSPSPNAFRLGIDALYMQASPVENSQHPNFINSNYHYGFDLNGSYRIYDTENDIFANWIHFNPGSEHGQGIESSNTAEQLSEIQSESYRLDIVNAELGHTFHHLDTDARIAVGLQYASLNYDATLINSSAEGASLFTVTNNKSSSFRGIGPRVGIISTYHFFNSDFYLVGSLAAGLLIGNASSPVSGSQSTNGDIVNLNRVSNNTSNVVIPELEAKLGVAYSRPFGGTKTINTKHIVNGNCSVTPTCAPCQVLTVEGGWQGWNYFNILRLGQDFSAIGTQAVPINTYNFAMQGPYLGVKYSFG